jgi:hypothetical protein
MITFYIGVLRIIILINIFYKNLTYLSKLRAFNL